MLNQDNDQIKAKSNEKVVDSRAYNRGFSTIFYAKWILSLKKRS